MLPNEKKINRQIVGNAGVFYCSYKLSQRGWNVIMTARNARGIDIVAYNENATRMLGIQVKSLRRPNAAGKLRSDHIIGDFWIIVENAISLSPTCFVLTASEVKSLAIQNAHKRQVWLEKRDYRKDNFREAWARIGDGF